MKLAVEVTGAGPDLVLLHGWGMHGGVWDALAERLADAFTLHCVDLPGHGASDFDGDGDIEAWAVSVMAATPAGADWVGWSLGGLIGLQAGLLAPAHLRRLVLLASTPRFVRAGDWSCAIDGSVLALFAEQLEKDFAKTLRRFLSLQVRGSRHMAQTLRQLRARLSERGQPQAGALRAGLAMLRHADFRASLAACGVPVYLLLGERDTLVPPALADALPALPHYRVGGAGHAPFISHPDQCAGQIKRWLCAAEGVTHG